MNTGFGHKFYWINPFNCLITATIAVFSGRAIQMFFWDAPFRAFFWDELIFSPVLALFGISWEEYLTSPGMMQGLDILQLVFGIVFSLAAVFSIFLAKGNRAYWLTFVYLAATGFLILLVLLFFKDRHFQIGQLIELSLQVGTPLFLWYYIREGHISTSLYYGMLLATALTFTGHGLYAVGYYPVPGHFQQMIITIFEVNNYQALEILTWAGYLDFIAAVFIFVPGKLRQLGLIYMIIWGLATTSARILANIPYSSLSFILERWSFEFLYRFPHFLVPLALLLWEVINPKSRPT